MVKTYKNSRFVLYSLGQIRDTSEIVLQIEDTHTQFEGGHKCYLCEVVRSYEYNHTRTEQDLIKEICELNADKRKLEKKVAKLEKALQVTGK